jgi:hypothetical protein
MASKLRFTDGTTTVTFDGTTDGKIVKYDILSPQLRTLTVSKITRDGTDMIAQAYDDVTESIDLYVSGTWSQITTAIRKLNRMWERVRRYQEAPNESPVYIEVQPDGDSAYWRSELKSVTTDLEPQALDLYLGQGKVIFNVTIVRAYFWEASTETELSLYNPGQAKGTGGKQVDNARDSNGGGTDRYNYLDIDNADLTGDLPSRIRLKMTNTYNNADRINRVYIGMTFKSDVANFTHVIEGESTTMGTQGPGSPDYTLYSEGYFRTLSWTGTTEQTLGRWDIPSTTLLAARSNYFMIYAKVWNIYTDVYLRPKITAVSGLTTLWSGPQILCPSGYDVVCLGAVQLPPVRMIGGTPYPEQFDITVQRAGGTGSMNVDFILFSPMDKWRQLLQNAYGLGYQAYLVDDGIGERLYSDGWTTAGNLYNFVGYGPWLEVTPVPESTGVHRIIFFWNGNTYAVPGRTMTVQAWYRPRRKQI